MVLELLLTMIASLVLAWLLLLLLLLLQSLLASSSKAPVFCYNMQPAAADTQ
jgi:hypothetical protein